MCAIASVFLAHELRRKQNLKPKVYHGVFFDSLQDPHARNHCWQHCWVEINNFLIDITVSQFTTNHPTPKVLVADQNHPLRRCYQYKKLRRGPKCFQDWETEQNPYAGHLLALTAPSPHAA
jgi:hypothetical protein